MRIVEKVAINKFVHNTLCKNVEERVMNKIFVSEPLDFHLVVVCVCSGSLDLAISNVLRVSSSPD